MITWNNSWRISRLFVPPTMQMVNDCICPTHYTASIDIRDNQCKISIAQNINSLQYTFPRAGKWSMTVSVHHIRQQIDAEILTTRIGYRCRLKAGKTSRGCSSMSMSLYTDATI